MNGLAIANNAIWIIKANGASANRGATTSAVSVAPGCYRVVLNSSDTNTLGPLTVGVSGSGAIYWRSDVDIIQKSTYDLFYGSADNVATSAVVAGVSAAVAGVSAAVAGVSAAVLTSAEVSVIAKQALDDYGANTVTPLTSAGLSAQVDTALDNYGVATGAQVAAVSVAVAGVSAAVAGVSAALLTSAEVSVISKQALEDYGANTVTPLTSAGLSAQVDTALDNYGVATGAQVAAVSVAVAGVSAAVLTSAEVSAIAKQALIDYDAVILGDLNNLSTADVSAALDTALDNYNVASVDDVGVGSGLTSAQASTIMQNVVNLNQIPSSAETSAIVDNALTLYGVATGSEVEGVSAAVAGVSTAVAAVANSVAAISAQVGGLNNLSTGDVSAALDTAMDNYNVASAGDILSAEAVWHVGAPEPTTPPVWASANRGQIVDWIGARSLNKHAQTQSKVEIYSTGGAPFASASAGNNSTSATRTQFV